MKSCSKEVHGILRNGKTVYLGSFQGTYEDAQKWLSDLTQADWASVGFHVFFPRKFASIQMQNFKEDEINGT